MSNKCNIFLNLCTKFNLSFHTFHYHNYNHDEYRCTFPNLLPFYLKINPSSSFLPVLEEATPILSRLILPPAFSFIEYCYLSYSLYPREKKLAVGFLSSRTWINF